MSGETEVLSLRLQKATYARLLLIADERGVPAARVAAEVLADFAEDPGEAPVPAGAALLDAIEATFTGRPAAREGGGSAGDVSEPCPGGGGRWGRCRSAARQLSALLGVASGAKERWPGCLSRWMPTLLLMSRSRAVGGGCALCGGRCVDDAGGVTPGSAVVAGCA